MLITMCFLLIQTAVHEGICESVRKGSAARPNGVDWLMNLQQYKESKKFGQTKKYEGKNELRNINMKQVMNFDLAKKRCNCSPQTDLPGDATFQRRTTAETGHIVAENGAVNEHKVQCSGSSTVGQLLDSSVQSVPDPNCTPGSNASLVTAVTNFISTTEPKPVAGTLAPLYSQNISTPISLEFTCDCGLQNEIDNTDSLLTTSENPSTATNPYWTTPLLWSSVSKVFSSKPAAPQVAQASAAAEHQLGDAEAPSSTTSATLATIKHSLAQTADKAVGNAVRSKMTASVVPLTSSKPLENITNIYARSSTIHSTPTSYLSVTWNLTTTTPSPVGFSSSSVPVLLNNFPVGVGRVGEGIDSSTASTVNDVTTPDAPTADSETTNEPINSDAILTTSEESTPGPNVPFCKDSLTAIACEDELGDACAILQEPNEYVLLNHLSFLGSRRTRHFSASSITF